MPAAKIQPSSALHHSPPLAGKAEVGSLIPSSPALSTASTAEDGGASPILPPLPAPTHHGHTLDIPRASTPHSEGLTELSRYYTASWGSPYAQVPESSRASDKLSQEYRSARSSDGSEASDSSPSIRHLEFHTPFLRPAPTFTRAHTDESYASNDSGISATVLANRARRPAQGLTEDWIRQHTGGEGTEPNNWLSDDPGDSEDEERSDDSKEGDVGDWGELDPRTPTLKRFLEGEGNRLREPLHRRQHTAETLRPDDFLEPVRRVSLAMSSIQDMEAEGNASTAMEGKPLPPPPDELNEWSKASDISPVRPKKKVPWKGKSIMVLIPWDDRRGQRGQPPTPMSQHEVSAMMKDWEQLGYDTAGFNLGSENAESEDVEGEGSAGQSRGVWPLTRDLDFDRAQRAFRVSIPNREEWEAYVQELKEAKLRALGVSFGDEDPPMISPALTNPMLNRRATITQYPPLPFSPPLPTSSAASSNGHRQMPFSPNLGAGVSTSQSSALGSIPSPASMHAPHLQGKFNRHQSVSYPNNDGFGSSYPYQQSHSPVWSPQQQMMYQQGHRVGSPSMHNLGSVMSPSSPLSNDGYFPSAEIPYQMQGRSPMLQNQLQQQMALQGARSPRLQELKEAEIEEDLTKSPATAQEPAHSANLNQNSSLQKEIDDAEYHLEEQFQRQLEHEDYSPHSDHGESSLDKLPDLDASRFTSGHENETILHHPQPHSRGHSLSQAPFVDGNDAFSGERKGEKVELSEVETNPSNLGTPAADDLEGSVSAVSNPWVDSKDQDPAPPPKRPGHKSKPSSLNVGAKEFKFEPSSAFASPQSANPFSFNTMPISFGPMSQNGPLSGASSHFSHRSTQSKINVDAPVFTPGQSDFSFFAAGPSFRSDSAAITPFSPQFSDFGSGPPSGGEAPIFAGINLAALGISKPDKTNRAIPIVRPVSSSRKDDEGEIFDQEGRITRSDSRTKRARGGKSNGDDIPLFAEPSKPFEGTAPKDMTDFTSEADKENSAPVDTTDQAADGKDVGPFEFAQQKQAEEFNAAIPPISRRYGSGLPGYGYHAPSDDEDDVSTDLEERPLSGTLKKGHTKTLSALSGDAKPFEFRPGAFNFTFGEPAVSAAAPFVPASQPVPDAQPRPALGLSSSRFAPSVTSPPIVPPRAGSPEMSMQPHEIQNFQSAIPQPQSPPRYNATTSEEGEERELTFEEIDAVMRQMAAAEQQNQNAEVQRWEQSSPSRSIRIPDNSSPIRLQPREMMRSDAPSPSPRRHQALPDQVEDPFMGPMARALGSPVHNLNHHDGSLPASEWDDVLSEGEEAKLHNRSLFFDSHVNNVVGDIISRRLDPLEKTLGAIQISLGTMATQTSSNRHHRHSLSGVLSDADDEDDEDEPQRSMSPRKDRKMEKIRAIVTEVFNNHASHRHTASTDAANNLGASEVPDSRNVLSALEEMKEQFGQSMRLDLRGEDLRNIVEEAVEARMPAAAQIDDVAVAKEAHMQARFAEYEEKLRVAEAKVEEEIENRRAAEDAKAETERLLNSALEEDARLRNVVDQRGANIEDEIANRRAAEDRLAEVQRLLRISSEEEDRLRDAMSEREVTVRRIADESEQKVRAAEEQRAKLLMRNVFLESEYEATGAREAGLRSQIQMAESDHREARTMAQNWQLEAERGLEAAKRHNDDAEQANETNKELRKTIDTLRIQMEESIRVRESMRSKLMDLQEGMARAAQNVADENAQRMKREQELIARQEVLDAKLQAEARTRERLEMEIERLEGGERQGMRAVSESKRLEALVDQLSNESHIAKQDAMRYQREFEEARESGLAEVGRTRHYMQAEIESANNQVNVVREALEDQITRLRAEVDHVKLEADSSAARSEMLVEEAVASKKAMFQELVTKHSNEVEDMQTQHERHLHNLAEDAQRSEQHLLERLSLSTAKTEHLQDRVQHLEEKLEVAKSAANAAANFARSASSLSSMISPTTVIHSAPPAPKAVPRGMELPEKISPQALRESIMVLQEQLQERETSIEKLEATISTLDPDAAVKIMKRDDEIIWLRELLSVRKSDLEDIVKALQMDNYDGKAVRDAAIRLKANLQMEEQERERALNGGSAISLANARGLLQTVGSSPRVANAVGPLAAAWGNWRKGNGSVSDLGSSSTPRAEPNASHPPPGSFLSGLLTPPNGGREATPTGGRFSARELNNRPRAKGPGAQRPREMASGGAMGSGGAGGSGKGGYERGQERGMRTPPMMRKASYDDDAQVRRESALGSGGGSSAGGGGRGGGGGADFSDAGFYDDDESEIEGGIYGGNFGR